MKRQLSSQRKKKCRSYIALGLIAFGMVSGAADLPWVYDTTGRVEAQPDAEIASSIYFSSKALHCGTGVGSRLASRFMDQEDSSGINLTSLKFGLRLLIR